MDEHGLNALDDLFCRRGTPPRILPNGKRLALCPSHDDHDPSLGYQVGETVPVVAYCLACSATLPAVLDALAATPEERGLVLGKAQGTPSRVAASDSGGHHYGSPLATYNYADENGTPLFRIVRYRNRPDGKKIFMAERWGSRGWEPGIKGVRLVPYHLPRVLEAIRSGKRIYICEGEKDADRLANEAMDRGMRRGPSAASNSPSQPAAPPIIRATPYPTKAEAPPNLYAKADTMLRGFTKDGVVHILGGATLPDGIFVKIIRE